MTVHCSHCKTQSQNSKNRMFVLCSVTSLYYLISFQMVFYPIWPGNDRWKAWMNEDDSLPKATLNTENLFLISIYGIVRRVVSISSRQWRISNKMKCILHINFMQAMGLHLLYGINDPQKFLKEKLYSSVIVIAFDFFGKSYDACLFGM